MEDIKITPEIGAEEGILRIRKAVGRWLSPSGIKARAAIAQVADVLLAVRLPVPPEPIGLEASKDPGLIAMCDVLAERQRLVTEGWTPDHDDKLNSCELAAAAACYAVGSPALTYSGAQVWPWASYLWEQTDYRRMLVKAGALILAEIERLDRAAYKAAVQEGIDDADAGNLIPLADVKARFEQRKPSAKTSVAMAQAVDLRENWSADDEARMDVVGQNGNDGEHYDVLLQAGLSWDEAPEWADKLGRVYGNSLFWYSADRYRYAHSGGEYPFTDGVNCLGGTHSLSEVTLIATRPVAEE